MGIYYKFNKDDLLYSVINSSPLISLASGSGGWRSNTGVSSSLSIYEGCRQRAGDSSLFVSPYFDSQFVTIYNPLPTFSSYPGTGSINFVRVNSSEAPSESSITKTNWYEEHFNPILSLYDYYSGFNSDYVTGSFDYYSLFFHRSSSLSSSYVEFDGQTLSSLTASFTCAAQIKPLDISVLSQSFVIQSQKDRWKFYIESGKLVFTDFVSYASSSNSVQLGVWNDVAVSVSGGNASFFIDSLSAGSSAFSSSLSSSAENFVIGCELSGTKEINGFNGFLFESRIWKSAKTLSSLSGTYNRTIFSSGSDSDLIHYVRFNDGPLSTAHGFSQGSGAFDYGVDGIHGELINFGSFSPASPSWQPNDNRNFVVRKNLVPNTITDLLVVHIPSMFYGIQIVTGSVNLTCDAYKNKGISRVLVDDGRGGLYVSGSLTRALSDEDYGGVKWNKVGNVFYNEGLIVIKDPSLLDFGSIQKDSDNLNTLRINFRGFERTSSKVVLCRIGSTEANASNNPTFYTTVSESSDGNLYKKKRTDGVTYISAVGIYNEDRKLVAIAKLAQPIRKREKDKILIRLRIDI
jgi:hypothetical protein